MPAPAPLDANPGFPDDSAWGFYYLPEREPLLEPGARAGRVAIGHYVEDLGAMIEFCVEWRLDKELNPLPAARLFGDTLSQLHPSAPVFLCLASIAERSPDFDAEELMESLRDARLYDFTDRDPSEGEAQRFSRARAQAIARAEAQELSAASARPAGKTPGARL